MNPVLLLHLQLLFVRELLAIHEEHHGREQLGESFLVLGGFVYVRRSIELAEVVADNHVEPNAIGMELAGFGFRFRFRLLLVLASSGGGWYCVCLNLFLLFPFLLLLIIVFVVALIPPFGQFSAVALCPRTGEFVELGSILREALLLHELHLIGVRGCRRETETAQVVSQSKVKGGNEKERRSHVVSLLDGAGGDPDRSPVDGAAGAGAVGVAVEAGIV